MYDSSGSIIFNATSASGSLPVKNTLIRISGADEENRFTVYSLITDEDGVTEPITLPAPSIALSLSPGPGERPYALYNVEVSANGYYPKRIFSIEVFPDTKSNRLICQNT